MTATRWISVPNPDDEHDMPIYTGDAESANLIPGEYKAVDADQNTVTLVVTATRSYVKPAMCTKHVAFEADNCPGCGTATKIRTDL